MSDDYEPSVEDAVRHMTVEERELEAIDDAPETVVDEHPEPTEEEIAEGNRLGEQIDVSDDDDQGDVESARPVTRARPELEQADE